MKKRVISILLAALMLLSIMPLSVVFAAGTVSIFVTADKTSACPDDVVSFTVSVGAVNHLMGAEFQVKVPTGMTYVNNSAVVADGLKATLGCASADWTESSMKFTMYGDGDYSSNSTTEFLTFSCKINQSTTGTIAPQITELVLSDTNFEEISTEVNYDGGIVTVGQHPTSVTGVVIDETLSLNLGEKKTPAYTVNPDNATNKTVTFTTSDSTVASVNETTGAVTGLKKGTAVITVTTNDGGFSDTCTVTVACTHANKSSIAAQDSTCKDQGWDAYKRCDDCGQLFNTSDAEIAAIPLRVLSNTHTGGTATCTAKAVCTVCGQSYGDFAAHTYTAATKKAEALKTAGNCQNKAVYYYSCSACGQVENNDSHTFEGEKDANNHVGGTMIVSASEPDHKNQVDGYTGDTKCLGCQTIIANGSVIPVGAHTPSSVWNTDGTNHWKTCTTVGCGVEIDGSKAPHSSTGTNVATCQHKAVCDVCHAEYGSYAAHNPASEWTKDATGHWHACQTANCTEKLVFAAHTPDHAGGATEEYAIKCSVCGYVITPALGQPDDEQGSDGSPATGTVTDSSVEPSKGNMIGETAKSPKTGDNSNIVLWLAVLLLSGTVVSCLVYRKKRSAK